ncbi:flagellar basal body L-ring protein FlgH [Lentisphaerota bacterium WC36G]|nr:flagellar basal body L-ring protein FlgH [Lentisphaerae bacterium WC36]
MKTKITVANHSQLQFKRNLKFLCVTLVFGCFLGSSSLNAAVETKNSNITTKTENAVTKDEVKLALNMYSNRRANQVGDLLTISIKEYFNSSKTESFNTEKQIKADAESPYLGQTVNAHNIFQQLANNIKRLTSNGNLPISEYKIQGASSFKGSGNATSNEALSYKITARVVDKLDNGILVIRGDRRVVIRNESISVVVTGLVRNRDINNENEVLSDRLADAHVYYETNGEVSRGSRPGYFWRFFQFLNPL